MNLAFDQKKNRVGWIRRPGRKANSFTFPIAGQTLPYLRSSPCSLGRFILTCPTVQSAVLPLSGSRFLEVIPVEVERSCINTLVMQVEEVDFHDGNKIPK